VKTAGLSLDHVAADRVGRDAEIWEKVAMKLTSGLMPPLGQPRPDAVQAAAFVSALHERLDEAVAAAPNPGRPVTHRLNRTEYANSINDLFGLDIDPRTILPADDTDQHGFDNNGDVLSLAPTLLERYLSAARNIRRAQGWTPSQICPGDAARQPASHDARHVRRARSRPRRR
jgi:hypothetical protein